MADGSSTIPRSRDGRKTQKTKAGLALLLCVPLAACGSPEPATAISAPMASVDAPDVAGYQGLPGWGDDDLIGALPAWRASCAAFAVKEPAWLADGKGVLGRAEDWRAPCGALPGEAATPEEFRAYIETWFTPMAVAQGESGLITGYYEPELEGARRRSAAHPVPIYRPPPDLPKTGKLQPYHTRAEIEEGVLAGRGLELLWLADPIDAFFLQVQGSGRVRLAGGSLIRVGYAANNGHPYTAIGRILVERGELTKESATMQTVRQWLRDHPDEATALMRKNARYIFFREIAGAGPVGSLGAVLTPGRSLAVDPDQVPLGALLWLDTTYPAGTPEAGRPLRRLMVAQDTGSAIKGAVRGDIFWGSGEAALRYAGPMKQPGRYFLLLPKTVAGRPVAPS